MNKIQKMTTNKFKNITFNLWLQKLLNIFGKKRCNAILHTTDARITYILCNIRLMLIYMFVKLFNFYYKIMIFLYIIPFDDGYFISISFSCKIMCIFRNNAQLNFIAILLWSICILTEWFESFTWTCNCFFHYHNYCNVCLICHLTFWRILWGFYLAFFLIEKIYGEFSI